MFFLSLVKVKYILYHIDDDDYCYYCLSLIRLLLKEECVSGSSSMLVV